MDAIDISRLPGAVLLVLYLTAVAALTAYGIVRCRRKAPGPSRPQPGPSRPHWYISTGCFHDDHAYCQSMTGLNGAKRPGRCKHCDAPCRCPCHRSDVSEPERQTP